MILVGDYIPKQKVVTIDLPPGLILANLEGPVVGDTVLAASPKSGPSLRTRALSLDGREFAFVLANNHLMDYGVEGLNLTRQTLRAAKVPFCGAGDNSASAREPMILEADGKKIGIISCCERQFGVAEENRPGCAEKGLWLLAAVRELKAKVDFVIVSCHAAFEHSPFPSPRLREFYRLLIDSGADIIHGHHAHVPQGWEHYKQGYIFYGLGNFVVDPESWCIKNHRRSLLVRLNFSSSAVTAEILFAQVELTDDNMIHVRLSNNVEAADFRDYAVFCNAALKNEQTLQIAWEAVCSLLYDRLYGVFLHTSGFKTTHPLTMRNRVRYGLDGLSAICAAILGRKSVTSKGFVRNLVWQNFFQCDSHVEVIQTALSVQMGGGALKSILGIMQCLGQYEIQKVE